jgi:thioredoxin 1
MLAPTLDHVAKDFSGSLMVVKVDVDRRPTIAARFGIQGVPTLILFRDGQAVWRRSGVISYPELASEVRKHINA